MRQTLSSPRHFWFSVFDHSSRKPNSDRVRNSHGEVLLQEAAVPQQARPQLHANDAEDEEDEETEQEHISQHGQRVEQ